MIIHTASQFSRQDAPLAQVLDRLDGVQSARNGFVACCPVPGHGKGRGDRNPSLSVSEDDYGQALLKCWAGCSLDEILSAVGLDRQDLCPVSYNGHRSATGTWHIRDAEGEVQAVHVRFDGPDRKQVLWKLPGADSWGLDGRKTESLPLYASEQVKDWDADVPIIVCEGEKACDALLAAKVPAVGTVTGASGTPSDQALEVLRGRSVVLWPDADEPGRKHMARVAERLQGVAKKIRVYEWPEAPEGNDAADHPAVIAKSRSGVRALYDEMADTPVWEPKGKVSLSSSLSSRDTRDTLKVVRFSEMRAPKERRYLIAGLVPEAYPTIVFGDGGVAKSMLMLSAAIAVSSGTELWLGMPVEGCLVLYLDFELDMDEQNRRARRLAKGAGLDSVPDELFYLSALGHSPDEAFKTALETCREYSIKLLVLDSLGPALEGDAMAARDVIGFYQGRLEPFRAAGVAVVIVDHQSKLQPGDKYQGKRAFGSVYKGNLARSVVQVEADERGADTLSVKFRQFKHNFGALAEPFGAKLAFEADRTTVERTELSASQLAEEGMLNATDRVKLALEGGPAFPQEIADMTGLALKTVKNVLSRLRASGEVEETGERDGQARQVSLVSLELRDGDRDT